MLDLVVPHVAREARLVQERPDWFRWQDGQPAAPVLANPTDPRHPRHMSDLAELELGRRELWPAQAEHFLGFIRHYLELGASGFRCSSAYKVPPELWRWLIGAARDTHKDAVFLAAALGCSFDQVRPLAGCGFDLIFDSSCWWDFHAHWFLDQNDELRRIAPTVAFPEDHNTPRLAERFDVEGPDETARLYRARYLSRAGPRLGRADPDGLRVRLPPPARPRPHHARGLAQPEGRGRDRPHRLPRRGQRLQARHHGAGHRRPACAGSARPTAASWACCASTPARRSRPGARRSRSSTPTSPALTASTSGRS